MLASTGGLLKRKAGQRSPQVGASRPLQLLVSSCISLARDLLTRSCR
jgi:hypothetical protein